MIKLDCVTKKEIYKIRVQVWDEVKNQVDNQVRSCGLEIARTQVGNQVWDQVYWQVRGKVWFQVRGQGGMLVERVLERVWFQVRSHNYD